MKVEVNTQKMYTESQVLDIICHILGCDIDEAKNCMKGIYMPGHEVADIGNTYYLAVNKEDEN